MSESGGAKRNPADFYSQRRFGVLSEKNETRTSEKSSFTTCTTTILSSKSTHFSPSLSAFLILPSRLSSSCVYSSSG